MTDMKNKLEEAAARIEVIAELLDADGVPCDVTTGNALVNLGLDILINCEIPKDMVAAMCDSAAKSIRSGYRMTRKNGER